LNEAEQTTEAHALRFAWISILGVPLCILSAWPLPMWLAICVGIGWSGGCIWLSRRAQKRSLLGLEARTAGLLGGLSDLEARLASTRADLQNEHVLSVRILSAMREGVMVLGAEREVILSNPALREMLLLPVDPIGKPLLEVIRKEELQSLIDDAPNEPPPIEIEIGTLKPRRASVVARRLPGTARSTMLVFVDVTELRGLERMRTDFVANVSHELRTPVTSILSAAETLPRALLRGPEAAQAFLEIIVRNSERLRALIEDLLDLSKIESKELRLAPDWIQLEGFFEHILALFGERTAARRITISVDIARTTRVATDRRALEQIVTNLIDNAVKYGRSGGQVKVTCEPFRDGVRMSVSDDGFGIPREHLPRLFERFYRIDPGRSREVGGTGLGLAICKHLAEALSGTIEVTSEVSKGTVFSVVLPNLKLNTPEKPTKTPEPTGIRASR
jgi:two-component system, OmpR family, phosphate regulon sensor histidine kinase PhoR